LNFLAREHGGARKIGILGSCGTVSSQIYQKHARRLHCDYEFLYPGQRLQRSVDDGISAVKSGLQYVSPAAARAFFTGAADDLIARNADVIVLGCTEIPLAIRDENHAGKPMIDTISVLAEACIARCKR
jgi:aspartate racemase